MKNYTTQNYYELLEVSPDATSEEITKAYQNAQEAFNEDSVAIYSLFDSQEDRTALLTRIQDAYRTLSNGRTRREYDRQLAEDGFVPDQRHLEPVAQPEEEEPVMMARPKVEHAPLAPLSRDEGQPLEVEEGVPLYGRDLVALRESRSISLEKIAERTRVNAEILSALESDDHSRLPAMVYVKGFLKAYARALKVNPEILSQAYLVGMEEPD